MSRIAVRPDDLAWRQVGDDIVVLDERTSKYLQLQGSGAVLWLALVEGTSPEELAASLVQRFGISEDLARHDVDAFLADLTQRELVAAE